MNREATFISLAGLVDAFDQAGEFHQGEACMNKAIEVTWTCTVVGIEADGRAAIVEVALTTPEGVQLAKWPTVRVEVGGNHAIAPCYVIMRHQGMTNFLLETIFELPEEKKEKPLEAPPERPRLAKPIK